MQYIDRRTLLKSAAAWALAPLIGAAQDKPGPYDDAVLIPGEPPPPRPGAFTIAVLPDTQHYSEKFPDLFRAQTIWIRERQRERNIVAVLHLGDITNRNTVPEWKNAQKAMRELDGRVSYFMSPGNHDYSAGGGCKDRTTLLNDYFSVNDFRSRPNFGGAYDKEPQRMENSYHLFSAGGRKFLVLNLEFGPRADVVRWANDIATRHADREAILVTHAFIYFDDTRYHWKKFGKKQLWNPHAYKVAETTGGDVSDGEELWENLVARHENFIFAINGHVLGDGLGRYSSQTPGGRDVPQMLVNFQMRPSGGDGWLRLLEFQPDGRTIEVHDYSPTRRQRNESANNRFTMQTAAVRG